MIEDNPKIYEYNPEEFNHTIFKEYFNNGIEKVKKLGLTLSPNERFASKEDFAQRIGFAGKEDHFNLICGDDNEVDEIHICYNRTRIPGKETTVECPNYENCDKHEYFVIHWLILSIFISLILPAVVWCDCIYNAIGWI